MAINTVITKRPFFVSLSIVFLWASIVLSLIGYYRTAEYLLSSGWENRISFFVGFVAMVYILVTVIHIQNQSKLGRTLGLVAFGLLILDGLYGLYTLADWPSGRNNSGLAIAWAIILIRLAVSTALLSAFIFSERVKNYFPAAADVFTEPPPPPASFED